MNQHRPTTYPPIIINGAFLLGLLTSVAFRAILIAQHIDPGWVRPLWYFAVGGNLIFFWYRYLITIRRKQAVARNDLIEKVRDGVPLKEEDREVMLYLLSSIKLSRENLNYAIISGFSLLAIALDLLLARS